MDRVSIKLNQLNYLIGKENLKKAVEDLYRENKNTFEVLNILVAVRDNKKVISENGNIVYLKTYFETPERIVEYIEKTGLVEIFKGEKHITNLIDYVFGIEVGLDTNARKNRGGDNMSKAVSLIFDKANVFYKREVSSTGFPEIRSLGADVKRFDFVIVTTRKTYLIEANYYNSGGSKLNEVARSYSDIAPKINQYPKYEFVWITDGCGWYSAKNKLEEAYNIIPSLYNLATLEDFVKKIIPEEIVRF